LHVAIIDGGIGPVCHPNEFVVFGTLTV